MTPLEYACRYFALSVMLDNNQLVTARIDKYLQNNGSLRNKNGLAAKDAIIGAMVAETKSSWGASVYKIDGWPINKVGVVSVFMGKGSPAEIELALWLASRYGLIEIDPKRKNNSGVLTRTFRNFCDDCVGLDCNGFVNNYFSLNPDTPIASYDKNYPKSRRQKLDDVEEGDVVVFVKEDDASAKNPHSAPPAYVHYEHIALIGEVAALGDDELALLLVQSSGNEVGLHASSSTQKFANHGKGVFFTSGARKAYVVPPPPGAGNPKL